MTTLTVNVQNDKDLPVLQEILDRFGIPYAVDADKEYVFSEAEIESLVQTTQDYIDGKTTARDWDEVKAELKREFN